MNGVVTREAMERLRKKQALDLAIEAVEWDLDRHRHSFSEQMSMCVHLKKLRAMRAALMEEFDEGNQREMRDEARHS